MNSVRALLVVVVVVVGATATAVAAADPPGTSPIPQVTVTVWNRFPAVENGVEATIHCWSGDNDLGTSGGAPDITIISFEFQPNLQGNTHFYCTVTRGDTNAASHFDVYWYERDNQRCSTKCDWSVEPDGVHGIDQKSGKHDLIYPWGN